MTGVLIDSDLTFSNRIEAVTKAVFYHLRNINRIKGFLSQTDQEKLIHAFISSRLDYCNGLLIGLPKKSIKHLQLIQNAAARVWTRTKRYEHITPVLKSLHWLLVSHRIDFKSLLMVYKSQNGLGPKYICDMITSTLNCFVHEMYYTNKSDFKFEWLSPQHRNANVVTVNNRNIVENAFLTPVQKKHQDTSCQPFWVMWAWWRS